MRQPAESSIVSLLLNITVANNTMRHVTNSSLIILTFLLTVKVASERRVISYFNAP